MTRLGSFTSAEMGGASPRTLVVALGSIEQHGPHLPLDTDVLVAEAIARLVVVSSTGFIEGPTLPVGAAGEHARFAGTLSIGTRVLTDVIVEVRRSMGSEFGPLAIVNGHGGNAEALAAAASLCAAEGREVRSWTARLPDSDAHAGRTETSLMLAIAPDAVHLDRAQPGATEPLADLMPRLKEGGVISVSPNGVLGDPTGASAEEGRRTLDTLVADAIRVLSTPSSVGG